MKKFKKISSLLLVAIFTLSSFTLGLTAFSDNKYKNGDIIEFGSYPQSQITDENVIAALNSSVSSEDFISFGYYSGTGALGTKNYGTEKSGDFMLYTDTLYEGVKYRGVIINEKRPLYTYNSTGTYKLTQNGYTLGETYWFRYDPIKWQILDIDSGLVITKAALDAQPMNNSTLTADESGNNSVYSSSSLHNFVTNTFYNTAFGGDSSLFKNVRDDIVFIPTREDILNTDYGFSTDSETVSLSAYADVTDYDFINALLGVTLEEGTYAPYWLDSSVNNTVDHSVYATSSLQSTIVYQTLGVRIAAYLDIENAADTYSLNYMSDGKTVNKVALHEGDNIDEYIPEKDHYGFTGWDCSIPATMPSHDITVNAGWKINSNKLSINANDGYFEDGTQLKEYTVNYDEDLSNYVETPSRQGYVFSGWDKTVPVNMPDNTLELNAVWTEAEDTQYVINIYKEKASGDKNGNKEYDIETVNMTGRTNSTVTYTPQSLDYFNFDEESSNINESVKADGSTVLNAYYLRKTGIIVFSIGAGYSSINQEYKYGQEIHYPEIPDRKGYSGKWNSTDNIYDGTVNKYSVIWTPNTYSISFDTDGGSNINNIVAACDSPVTAPENPVKEGYKFIGWDKEFPSTMPAEGLELKAIWEKESYNVNYIIDDNVITVSVLYGETIPVQETPVAEGKTFIRWSPDIPDSMPAYDLTFYAVFNTNEYTVTWNYGDKSESVVYNYGDSILIPENTVKEGYKFIKWDKEIPETMPANDLEFNAVYEICSYTVKFTADGVTVQESTVNYGENIKAPSAPEVTGYTFLKWDNLPSVMPASDIEVNAVYSKNTYTLTYLYGDKVKTYNVGYHENLPVPDDVEISGFTFKGWNESVPKSMPANDLTFTAVYEITPVISIAGCRNRTEKYKSTITLHADYTGCESSEIIWYDNNGNIIGTGDKVTVTQAKNSFSVHAEIVKNGTSVAKSANENINIKNGFFDKIISFFIRLFVPDKLIIDQK